MPERCRTMIPMTMALACGLYERADGATLHCSTCCAVGFNHPVLYCFTVLVLQEASVLMEHENAFQTGPVRCVSAHTYMRLRFLDRQMVESKFKGVLSSKEIQGLLERKDKVRVAAL